MNSLFQKTSSHWAKYSEYEYRQGSDGVLYITPGPMSKPIVYDPLKNAETMVVDALNVGSLTMKRAEEEMLKQAVLEFVTKYGLLGFMTALPTTAQYLDFDYEAVYLPKNHFLKEESMNSNDYIALFFPFTKLDFHKSKDRAVFNVSDRTADRDMLALAMTFSNEPMAMSLCLQQEYAEPYDWLVTQFKDLYFTFVACFLYYEDYGNVDEDTRSLYRQGMEAFGGIAPTYHIALYEGGPKIVWDFHSLLRGLQMMFSFALTDEQNPMRACRHCNKVFIAQDPRAAFCSPSCKNRYNVYKSRSRKAKNPGK